MCVVLLYLVVAFLVVSPNVERPLHQQLTQLTQVSLWTCTHPITFQRTTHYKHVLHTVVLQGCTVAPHR